VKVYVMTDMEGVAGVLNFEEWTGPGRPYYELAKEFLTLEVNAAIDGLLEGRATDILVQDAHGPGGINVKLLVLVNRPWSRPESLGELSAQFCSWYHLKPEHWRLRAPLSR